MSNDCNSRDGTGRRTSSRRTILEGLAAVGSLALAGCSGGSDTGETDTRSGDGSGEGSGCPKTPLSYTERTVTESDGSPGFSAEAPKSARELTTDRVLSFQIEGGEKAALVQASSKPGDGTVSETIAAMGDGFTEVTDRYDFATSGARALTINPKRISKTTVVLPADGNAIVVLVSSTIPEGSCRTAAKAAHKHIVKTVSPL